MLLPASLDDGDERESGGEIHPFSGRKRSLSFKTRLL
jgi:hypothetical protein